MQITTQVTITQASSIPRPIEHIVPTASEAACIPETKLSPQSAAMNPLGTPAHTLLPVNVGDKNKSKASTTQRGVLSNNTQQANTTATATAKQNHKKLYNSFTSFLTPPPSTKPSSKDKEHHPHSMYLHLDPASAGFTGESSSPSSRRHSLAISATGRSSRSSIDSALGPFASSRRVSTSVPTGAESAPLTAADALIGLIAASCQAQCDLEELNTSPTGRTAPLKKVHYEVKSFKMTAQLLHKVLRRVENGSLEHSQRPKLIELDVLIAVLTAAILTISELEARLESMVTQADELGVSVEEMVQRLSRSLAKDANRISMVEFTITKLLSVLQVSNPQEASRHQTQAGFAIMDMLQADAALAGRMQQLQDEANGLHLVSEARRAELASRPPPGYSVPSPRDDDELPNYYEALDDDSVAIQPRDWSVYSGLNLADISTLSRVSLPLILGEINDGYYYTKEYAQSISEALIALEDAQGGQKSKVLAHVLGIKDGGIKETSKSSSDQGGLAHRLAQKVARARLLGGLH